VRDTYSPSGAMFISTRINDNSNSQVNELLEYLKITRIKNKNFTRVFFTHQ